MPPGTRMESSDGVTRRESPCNYGLPSSSNLLCHKLSKQSSARNKQILSVSICDGRWPGKFPQDPHGYLGNENTALSQCWVDLQEHHLEDIALCHNNLVSSQCSATIFWELLYFSCYYSNITYAISASFWSDTYHVCVISLYSSLKIVTPFDIISKQIWQYSPWQISFWKDF